MDRAGIARITGRPRERRAKPEQIASDLVDRRFSRLAANQGVGDR
jgi:putative transposase